MAEGRVYGSPVGGAVLRLSQCEDESFAQGRLGRGVLLMPTTTEVQAPADGEVKFVMSTGHAVVLETAAGEQMILHVGLETNKLRGRGFRVRVERGEKVRRGETLLTFDAGELAAYNQTQALLFILSNPGNCIQVLKHGPITAGEDLLLCY